MSRIRALQLLQIEEFPKQKDWIGKLIYPVNDFIKQCVSIINDGILFSDNLVGVDHVFKFTYQSDEVTFPLSFKWNKPVKPLALSVVSATEQSGPNSSESVPVYPIIALVAWSFTSDGSVQLTRVIKVTSAPALSAIASANIYPGVDLTQGYVYEIRCRITP